MKNLKKKKHGKRIKITKPEKSFRPKNVFKIIIIIIIISLLFVLSLSKFQFRSNLKFKRFNIITPQAETIPFTIDWLLAFFPISSVSFSFWFAFGGINSKAFAICCYFAFDVIDFRFYCYVVSNQQKPNQ